jgi:hypothetical protein
MGHQVSDLCPAEIGERKRLEVEEEPVPKGLFDSAGGPQKVVSPHVSESADAKRKEEDFSGVNEEARGMDTSRREVIDGVLNHPGDKELENVHNEQGHEPDQELPAVLHKIAFKGLEGFDRRWILHKAHLKFNQPLSEKSMQEKHFRQNHVRS